MRRRHCHCNGIRGGQFVYAHQQVIRYPQSNRLCVNGKPSVDSVIDGVEQARQAKCDMVVAIGGGSVIDTGKVIAALLTNAGDVTAYLEIIGIEELRRQLKTPSST
ncbi:MAG: iron-containing alcohol dehydrogenase [Desulfobacterales bacterium]